MSKSCAKCDKTVYPLEELKCLDKVWHKTCFKCQECSMTLSMRNYKGFNRLPYCTAHCPQAKHTTVADTPEIRRIQENTKIQSTVKYHEEFERQKGKVTQIADDPETLRIKANTRIISNVAYHGDLERKAQMEQKRPPALEGEEEEDYDVTSASPINSIIDPPQPISTVNQAEAYQSIPQTHTHVARVAEMDASHAKDSSPYSSRQASTVIYTSEHGPAAQKGYWGHGSTVIYSSDFGQVSSPPSRRIGSIADYDPVNDNFGSASTAMHPGQYRIGGGDVGIPQAPRNSGKQYRAMYDYTAADSDEVSFADGDIIINCTAVDEGWMTGIVQRTGQKGMLPANYVELVN